MSTAFLHVRVGVSVIIEKEGKILLGLRTTQHGGGTWACPGGHLELGESPEDCAAREAMEETGMTLRNIRRYAFTSDVFTESGKHYITLFMRAEPEDGQEPRNMEPEKCAGWQWFSPDDLPQPLMLSTANLLKDGYRLVEAA